MSLVNKKIVNILEKLQFTVAPGIVFVMLLYNVLLIFKISLDYLQLE